MSYEATQRDALAQRRLSRAGAFGGAIAIIILAAGITHRVKHEHQLKGWTEAQADRP